MNAHEVVVDAQSTSTVDEQRNSAGRQGRKLFTESAEHGEAIDEKPVCANEIKKSFCHVHTHGSTSCRSAVRGL